MKKIEKVLIFRIPDDLNYAVTLPSQAVGLISNYLRENNINSFSYDIIDILGKGNAADLISKIYNSKKTEDYTDESNYEFDSCFGDIPSKISLASFSLLLISLDPLSPQGAIAAILFSRFIKRIKKDMIIILGGENQNLGIQYIEDLFRKNKLNNLIDFIVKGNHIENIVKIIECIEEGRDLPELPSIIYYDYKKNKITETPYFEKAHILGRLDFTHLNLDYYRMDLADYLPKRYVLESEKRVLMLPFTFIYGCPHVCAFCNRSASKLLNRLEPEEVVRLMGEFSSRYKTHYFMFLNCTLNTRYDYTDELCERIIQSGISAAWSDCVHFRNLDKKILLKMKKAGAARLVFGLETGSDRMLKICLKGTAAKEAGRCLEWSHESGIWNGVEVIAGLPYEREADVDSTIDFINSNRNVIDEIYVNPFMLYDGSCFFERSHFFNLENILIDEDTNLFRRFKGVGNVVLDHSSYKYRFDEKNGLRWDEKMRQIDHSYNKVLRYSKVRHYTATNADLQVLLYLYRNFGDKEKIRKIYNSFLKHTYFKKIMTRDGVINFFKKRQYFSGAINFFKQLFR